MRQTPTSQQAKAVINEQEARTELLATLAAGRELGPDMDQTLASRFMEQLDTLLPSATRDGARLRRDVEALLASARTHTADADEARVDDFLKSALAPQPAAPQLSPQPPYLMMRRGPGAFIPLVVCIVGVVAIGALFGWHAPWALFWLIPLLFWSSRGRRRMRYRRYGYWDDGGMGYGPRMGPPPDARRRLPPGDGPEII